jgi:hypothetical protein
VLPSTFNSRVKTSIISNTHHHHKHNTTLITRFRTEPDPDSPPQIAVFETAAGQPHTAASLSRTVRVFVLFFSVYSQSILLSVFVIFLRFALLFPQLLYLHAHQVVPLFKNIKSKQGERIYDSRCL